MTMVVDTTVVVASGEVDIATVNELEAELRAAHERSVRVVLDLRQVVFIDCAGLRCILSLKDAIEETGGEFLLIPGPSQVQRLFLLTRTYGALRFILPSEIGRRPR